MLPPPRVELSGDHLRVSLEGIAAVAHLRRSIVVPYSTITHVELGAPAWPGALEGWRAGAHLPRLVARGTFVTWKGHRRFFSIGRGTRRALTLHLREHPDYDRITLDVHDVDALARRIEERRREAVRP